MKIDIDIDRIFEERAGGVNDAGEVLATTMERIMQPYVPMSDGAAAHLVVAALAHDGKKRRIKNK